MDTLRGTFDNGFSAEDSQEWDAANDAVDSEDVRQIPPEAIGQDERRMQVRAYNHWASLLGDATFPSIEDLEPRELGDFGPNSVLLDFSAGVEDPVVQFLGPVLAQECGTDGPIERLSDVPARSLLSRITDHYMQILANQAPIGFEAEFINQRGTPILYRGILLPFSSDHETIDFIYGVINWKEMADAATADELLLEIDQALDIDEDEPVEDEDQPHKHHADPLTEWADSPASEEDDISDPLAASLAAGETHPDHSVHDNITALDASVPEFTALKQDGDNAGNSADDLPMPDFGQYTLDDPEVDEFGEEIQEDDNRSSYSFASLSDYIEAPAKKAIDLDADEFDPEDYRPENMTAEDIAPQAGPVADSVVEPVAVADAEHVADVVEDKAAPADLLGCLASARELAQSAEVSEDRSRHALYAAVGRAYDVSLAAKEEPEAYDALIADSGMSVQDRAPMTPIVKLVFGQDYDKTRLTEYAAVLSHAHRLELERGSLTRFLSDVEGGLKGVVKAERRLRREESGKEVENEGEIRAQLAQKLRELEELTLQALSGEGPEFSLALLRRDANGRAAIIGELAEDTALIERLGKKLVG